MMAIQGVKLMAIAMIASMASAARRSVLASEISPGMMKRVGVFALLDRSWFTLPHITVDRARMEALAGRDRFPVLPVPLEQPPTQNKPNAPIVPQTAMLLTAGLRNVYLVPKENTSQVQAKVTVYLATSFVLSAMEQLRIARPV